MASSSSSASFDPKVLMDKGKRATAAYIHADCSSTPCPQHLTEVLDSLLNPKKKAIDEWETVDWCKWLMAGGRTPDEFANIVRTYDNTTKCGLVWTPSFVAYRCKTCSKSPCMSLCTECFKKGNHQRHDFNMFQSQAGGACDCGDTAVMEEDGFCDRHGPNKSTNNRKAPTDLMCVAEAMMPRVIFRLILHLRENCHIKDHQSGPIQDADLFIQMLLDFNDMGGLMRKVITSALTNPQKYRVLNEIPENSDPEYAAYVAETKEIYERALKLLPNPEPIEEYKNCPSLQENLVHKTFLEELVFWTVMFEFPQKIVCLLLKMLPDPDYKEALTRAFVLHYSRISMMLERSSDPDTLSNRVVHVSVQLFSNESLATRMTEQLNLLHVMVVSLRYMMSKILIPNTLHDSMKNFHFVVDCGKPVMKDHCYWPLVSDLNNVLSHRPVALKFLADNKLVEMWFEFLAMFQGMNVNQREMNQHVEFEPNTYYAAFSAELEASAYPMWALVSHLTDSTTADCTKRVLMTCAKELRDWLDGINYTSVNMNDNLQVSFHLPLHRYFSVFLNQAISKQGVSLDEVLPSDEEMNLMMMHPLRVQVAFYEILNGLWVRNGLQIKGQAMTYIQCNFCNSMVDADLYLLQIASTRMASDEFMKILMDRFHIKEWMSLAPYRVPRSTYLEAEQDTPMVESFLTFLATLVSIRTNIGLSETDLNRLEMVTLLCMGDKTHSQLMELMPERCGTSQSRDFNLLLDEVADYRAPALEASGNLHQGMYSPKSHVWENLYDPIHVLLRAVHRRDFQTSMDRYTEHVMHANKIKTGISPWPPFRDPSECSPAYQDPRQVLKSKVFHAACLVILLKAVKGTVSEHMMALVIFLLDQALTVSEHGDNDSKMCTTGGPAPPRELKDMELDNWFQSDSLLENATAVIGRVTLQPEPEVSAVQYSSDDDSSDSPIEWDDTNHDLDIEMSDLERVEPLLISSADWSDPGQNLVVYVDPDRVNENRRRIANRQQEAIRDSAQQAIPRRIPYQGLPALTVLALPASDDGAGGGGGAAAAAAGADGGTAAASPMDVDEVEDNAMAIAVALPEDRGPSDPPALPPPQQLAAITAGNEVGRTVPNWINESPSSSTELVPASVAGAGGGTPGHQKKYQFRSRRELLERQKLNPPQAKLHESIISLLLRLHSQLSGVQDSFNPDDEAPAATAGVPVPETEEAGTSSSSTAPGNSIGDGPFYIGRLLRRMCRLDENCKKCVQETRLKLWPTREEREEAKRQKENRERDERRRRAKERQQKLMAEFANKQKQFMERTMETDEVLNSDGEEILVSKQEYDCVICSQSTPSTEDKPMGLVVLVQATSVIGHRRRFGQPERSVLPTCDEDRAQLRRDDTLSAEFDRRLEELDRYFDPKSWYLSVNVGWDGGVHVQTCGHHLHLDCLNSYLNSLRSQQRQLNLQPEKGEYLCPLCRQLANSVLPLSPQLGDCAQMVRSRPSGMSQVLDELSEFLRENDQKPSNTNMAEAIGKIMEVMTGSTQLKPMFKPKSDKPIPQSLFLFVTSIARTNLEVQLIQRGGSLVTVTNEPPNPLLPKRDCIVPLLHVLSVHARVARVLAMWPAWMTFQQLCGMPPKAPSDMILAPVEQEVPLLLKDPIALLLQFVLLLPLHLDQTYFTTTVQMVYNLLYYQVVTQVSCGLSATERARTAAGSPTDLGGVGGAGGCGPINSLGGAMTLINKCLGHTDLYMDDDGAGCSSSSGHKPEVNTVALEQQIQKLCLPFLRIAALLKFHIYQQELPDIRNAQSEFVRLVYYLELVTESMDWECFNAAVALNWPLETAMNTASPEVWCNQFAVFVGKSQIAARSFLVDQHITWNQPRLLQLPREYEKIFTYYHERPCSQCQSVPQETSICLLCGTIVCLKQPCCKQQNVCEATAHALECGAGTGVFLVVTSTYIIVIRGHRACLWGSLYLDDFEEEDRDLKRGKPLYLSKDRYQLLEQQWLAHRFDHTKKTWVQHRNAL